MVDIEQAYAGAGQLILEWVFIAISGVFVGARLYFRWVMLRRTNSPSDIVILMTWLVSVISMALYTRVAWIGFWNDDIHPLDFTPGNPHSVWKRKDPKLVKEFFMITWASFIPFCITLWGVKLSLLLLYYSLVPRVLRHMRLALHLISAFVAVSFVVNLCLNLFYCHPVHLNWSNKEEDFCLSQEKKVPYFIGLVTHLASDFALYFFPFPLLRMLKIDPRQKLGVFFIFALGTFCIGCVIVRAIRSQSGATALITIDFWFALEQSLSIIVVCCPALKTLMNRRRMRRIVGGTGRSVVEANRRPGQKSWRSIKTSRTSRTVSIAMGTLNGTIQTADPSDNAADMRLDEIRELNSHSRPRSRDDGVPDIESCLDGDEIVFPEADGDPSNDGTRKLKVLHGRCVPNDYQG